MAYLEVSLSTQIILDTFLLPVIYLSVLPLILPFHAVRYVLNPPRMPSWTFSHYMTINILRSKQQFNMYRRLPARDPEESIIPPFADKYRRTCEVVKVVCPGLREEVPRITVLTRRRDLVVARPVPCFMINRRDAEPQGDLTRHARLDERIIYFIVGGGYVAGHPLRVHTPWSLAEITGTRVFCVNYRKSLSADSAFPASLFDCLAGYQYLVDELKFEPKNIMLFGESAGANACMAMTRYLGELEDAGYSSLGQVGSMSILCPWADMSSSFGSIARNRYTDHLIDLTTTHIPSHTRHFPGDTTNVYFSPALTPSGGYAHLSRRGVKVYISGGTAEAFYDEIAALSEGMTADGVDVTLKWVPGATHSDFVWMDRDVATMGWSWPKVKSDFEHFWAYTAIDE